METTSNLEGIDNTPPQTNSNPEIKSNDDFITFNEPSK